MNSRRELWFGITQSGTSNALIKDYFTLIIDNPFGQFTEMNLDTSRADEQRNLGSEELLYSDDTAFERTSFLNKLESPVKIVRTQGLYNKDHSNEVTFASRITISKEMNWITTGFQFDAEPYISEHGEQKCISEFYQIFRTALTFFPDLKQASAGSMDDISVVNREMKVGRYKPYHPAFGPNLNWINVVSPHAYHPFYKKEDILKTPAYHIEEWENDVLFIQLYENPFELFKQENKEIYRDASAWLFQCLNREEVNKPRKAT